MCASTCVQVSHAERLPDAPGMQGQHEETPALRPFAIQRVESLAHQRRPPGHRHAPVPVQVDIADFLHQGQRDEGAVDLADQIRLVIVRPVAEVVHADLRQQAGRPRRLALLGAEPPARHGVGHAADGVERKPDVGALVGFRHLSRDGAALADSVGDDFPAPPPAFSHQPRVALRGEGVDGRRGANRVRVEEIEQPEHADAMAVFPVRHGRVVRRWHDPEGTSVRWRVERLRRRIRLEMSRG